MDHPLKIARRRYNLTQQQLATKIGVSIRTISTAESGGRIGLDARRRLCKFFRLSAKELGLDSPNQEQAVAISDTVVITFSKQGDKVVAHFDETKREALQNMFTLLGIGSVFENTGTSFAKGRPSVRMDLNVVEDYADSLGRLIGNGEARYVAVQAKGLYDMLEQQYPDDSLVAITRLKVGMLLASAQEYTLPWYQRNQSVLQVYNALEAEVLPKCSPNNSLLHLKLLAKRSRYRRVLWQFDMGANECEIALSHMKGVENSALYTHFLCERAHIEATRGDEPLWLHKLEEARQKVLILNGPDLTKALNQINYIQGEGYKRFAYHTKKDYSLQTRLKHAKHALTHLDAWDGATIEVPSYEALVAQTSKAQCMILINPDEALHMAEQVRMKAMQSYPTLLDKVHRIELLAHRRLTTSDAEFLQLFQDTSHSAYMQGGNVL